VSCDILAVFVVYDDVQIALCCKYFCKDLLVNINVVMLNAKSVQVKVEVAMRRTGMSTKLALDFHRRAPTVNNKPRKGKRNPHLTCS